MNISAGFTRNINAPCASIPSTYAHTDFGYISIFVPGGSPITLDILLSFHFVLYIFFNSLIHLHNGQIYDYCAQKITNMQGTSNKVYTIGNLQITNLELPLIGGVYYQFGVPDTD